MTLSKIEMYHIVEPFAFLIVTMLAISPCFLGFEILHAKVLTKKETKKSPKFQQLRELKKFNAHIFCFYITCVACLIFFASVLSSEHIVKIKPGEAN